MAGKTDPADVLSILPLKNQPFREMDIAEEYINYVTVNAVPKALTLKQIVCATETDPILQQVQRCLGGSEWPDTPELNPYKRSKDELCMSNGIVLRGSRIVMQGYSGKQPYLMRTRATRELCEPNRWSGRRCGDEASPKKSRQW